MQNTDQTAVLTFQYPPPLSLYVHIPWCVRKCPYCDFNSHATHDGIPEQAYVDALLVDLEQELPGVWGRTVETIFIGGGTPSIFAPESIDRLVSGVKARLCCKPGLETTLEANPGTLENDRLVEFRDAGINRLSIGVQSFDDGCLQRIGRIHNNSAACRAIESAHQAGFDSFNVDLMFGLPDQSVGQALRDLETAITLEPPHLSWYQLTIEPNTLFFHQLPVLPPEEEIWEMQTDGQTLLSNQGYTQYEVSAYARDGRQCQHNLNYWRYGDYIGIGAGAHAKITNVAQGYIERTWKVKHPRSYLQHAATETRIEGKSRPAPGDVMFEFLLNSLRLHSGFSRDEYEMLTGLNFSELVKWLASRVDPELLELSGDRIRASRKGRGYLNNLLVDVLPDLKRQRTS